MKREKLLEKGYTEEQVSELLDMFHQNNADLVKQNENLTSELATANNKIAGLTEKEQELNTIKQAQLSEADKMALKQKEIDKNYSESKKILNEAKARVILSEIGGVSDSVLRTIVSDDENTTIQNANDLLNQFKTFQTETINKTKEELSSIDIKPNPSNTTQTTDVMDWNKFTSLSEDEQLKFQEEHPDEFAKL
jgi:cell division septum initiation protein DivIVA